MMNRNVPFSVDKKKKKRIHSKKINKTIKCLTLVNYKQKVRKMRCNRITRSHGSIVLSHLWRERLGQYCINFPNNLGLDLQIHTFPYKAEIVLFGSLTEHNAIA